jgi:hypothetical protein
MLTTDNWTPLIQAAIVSDRPGGNASDKPTAATLIQSLLQAEKSTRQTHQQIDQTDLMGDWQLFFSTTGKVKLGDRRLRGFYLPSWIPAQISFHPSESEASPIVITNQITLAGIHLKLSGPAKYSPKKNLLGFDFTQMEVKIFGQTVYNGKFLSPRANQPFDQMAMGKLPFFAFFAVNAQFIAARGRGGGLAIWVRPSGY